MNIIYIYYIIFIYFSYEKYLYKNINNKIFEIKLFLYTYVNYSYNKLIEIYFFKHFERV